MPFAELVMLKAAGAVEHFAVPESGIAIGRGEECGIVLSSRHASRVHARFWTESGSVFFEDLGSRNGVEVNGERRAGGMLSDGDRIVIGGQELVLRLGAESSFGRAAISRARAVELQESIIQDARDERLLALYRAANLLGEVFDLDELLDKILQQIFQALPVRRGYILTLSVEDRRPEIRAARSRGVAAEDGPPLSHTLIQHVFESGEAILTSDAREDSRFGNAESIMGHDIHAAMCAPLHGRSAVAGVIYVDVGNDSTPLSEADLELLSAIAGVVGVAVENARLYQENMERERLAAIGMATAGLGHCIKNILTGIRGGAQFVTMAIEKQDLKYLERGWPILRGATDRIDRLVMNMLVYSRDRKPERIRTDVNGLIRDVLGLFEERTKKYNVGLGFEPDAVGIANVDPQGIYRVILNLVVNAIEACEHNGGRVDVACICTEQGCTIRVADTGIGIPDEIIPQLSQAFVSSKGSAGTGLGLACSYKIAREHGGEIQVKRQARGGTVFTVFLPEQQRITEQIRRTTMRPKSTEDVSQGE